MTRRAQPTPHTVFNTMPRLIQWIVIHGVIPFITAGCTLIGMIYVTSQIDWQLALVALAVSPVLFLISRAYGPHLRSQWRQVKNLESSALSVVQEVLAAIRVVKAFGQEDHEQERFLRRASEGVWARIRITFAEGGFDFLVGLATTIGTAAVLASAYVTSKSGAFDSG